MHASRECGWPARCRWRIAVVGKDVLGNQFDAVGLGALADADGERVLVQVQDVAALDAVGQGAVVVVLHVLEIGVVPEDVVAVDGLAATSHREHPVDAHARADAGKRVTREIQVGHGLDHKAAVATHLVHQRVLHLVRVTGQVLQVDALHGFQHQLLAGRDAVQVVIDDVVVLCRTDAGLLDELTQELLPDLSADVKHLGHQVLEINHLNTIVTQHLREGIMFLLGHFQIGNIVKQQFLKRVGCQVEQFTSGTVQQNLLQRLYLTSNMNTSHDLEIISFLFMLWMFKFGCKGKQIPSTQHHFSHLFINMGRRWCHASCGFRYY